MLKFLFNIVSRSEKKTRFERLEMLFEKNQQTKNLHETRVDFTDLPSIQLRSALLVLKTSELFAI